MKLVLCCRASLTSTKKQLVALKETKMTPATRPSKQSAWSFWLILLAASLTLWSPTIAHARLLQTLAGSMTSSSSSSSSSRNLLQSGQKALMEALLNKDTTTATIEGANGSAGTSSFVFHLAVFCDGLRCGAHGTSAKAYHEM